MLIKESVLHPEIFQILSAIQAKKHTQKKNTGQHKVELYMCGGLAVPLSPLNKQEVLKTPYIQIWCHCGYISNPH